LETNRWRENVHSHLLVALGPVLRTRVPLTGLERRAATPHVQGALVGRYCHRGTLHTNAVLNVCAPAAIKCQNSHSYLGATEGVRSRSRKRPPGPLPLHGQSVPGCSPY